MTKVYFNELSARGSVDEADVKQTVSDLLSCLKHLHDRNVNAVIVDGAIGGYSISNRRTIYQILGDENILDSDSAIFLIEHFQEDYQLREEIEDNNVVSVKCKGRDAVGLMLASDELNNGVALSFSHAGWDEKAYDLQLEVLDEKGETREQTATAANASTESSLISFDELFPNTSVQEPESGKILFLELKEKFPNLQFSDGAKNFIKCCQSKVIIGHVFEKLYNLNGIASTFGGKPFEKTMFASKASPESDTRDRMPELDILFEDGVVRHCSWHLRYTPNAGRIHFSSDAGDGRTIYVGYIGDKINA